MEDKSNLLISTYAVSKILNVSTRTIQNYRVEGKLKYYKISQKKILYRVGDVVDFLNKSSCASLRKDKVNTLLEKYVVQL